MIVEVHFGMLTAFLGDRSHSFQGLWDICFILAHSWGGGGFPSTSRLEESIRDSMRARLISRIQQGLSSVYLDSHLSSNVMCTETWYQIVYLISTPFPDTSDDRTTPAVPNQRPFFFLPTKSLYVYRP